MRPIPAPACRTPRPPRNNVRDLVTSLDIVDGDYLVFTVGKLDESRPWYPFKELDVSVEAYNRHTGEKLSNTSRLCRLLGNSMGPSPWRPRLWR